jgi:hypothetical protein
MDDYAEISGLLHLYAELLNTGQFARVGELFAHGRVRVKGNPNVYEGAEEVAEMYRSTTNVPEQGPDSLLYVTNLQVSVKGLTATAKSYFMAYHQRPGVILPVVGGRYEDELAKVGDTWTFADRLMHIDLIGDLGTHLNGKMEDYLT